MAEQPIRYAVVCRKRGTYLGDGKWTSDDKTGTSLVPCWERDQAVRIAQAKSEGGKDEPEVVAIRPTKPGFRATREEVAEQAKQEKPLDNKLRGDVTVEELQAETIPREEETEEKKKRRTTK